MNATRFSSAGANAGTKLQRAVFTLATSKPVYLEMAFALARSFKVWHKNSDIRFFLATDTERSNLPADLLDIDLIPIAPGQFGKGFEPKLNLDRIAPAPRSLFIDADCLCVGSLETAFETFRGKPVCVIGREISDGEWFGDVAAICKRFSISAMPWFNGGVYYLEVGEACTRVYEMARALLPQYDELGFVPLRGGPNEEVLMSCAMARLGHKPVPERGNIMNDLHAARGGLEIDVFKGRAVLRNPKSHPNHNPWHEMEEMKPRLVHFCGADMRTYPYWREISRLAHVEQRRWPVWFATLWVSISFSLPSIISSRTRDLLRPVYRFFFGSRPIGINERL